MANPPGPKVRIDAKDLSSKFNEIKTVMPRVARQVRRELRASGDNIIAKQREILAGPKPAGVRVAGQRNTVIVNPKTGKVYERKVNVYKRQAVQKSRSRGLRKGIAASIRTQVVFGKSRTSLRIATANAKTTGANFYQAKIFRHPRFGDRSQWLYQRGMPYFWAPAYGGAKAMTKTITQIVDTAFDHLPDTKD